MALGGVVMHVHIDFGRGKPVLEHLAHVKMKILDPELAQFALQLGGRQAGIDQGAEDHVAGSAGDAVEVSGFHSRSSGKVGSFRRPVNRSFTFFCSERRFSGELRCGWRTFFPPEGPSAWSRFPYRPQAKMPAFPPSIFVGRFGAFAPSVSFSAFSYDKTTTFVSNSTTGLHSHETDRNPV